MKRLLRGLLDRVGVRLSRVADTVVLPRPRPGPAVFHCAGIDWNEPAVDPVLGRLDGLRREWSAIPGYDPDNPFFGLADAAVAWALVRERRPPVVVEVGSGHSSRVLRAALDANGGGRLVAIDPQPRASLAGIADEHRAVAVQKTPLTFFRELDPGSVLFVDSSHRAGTGSDVDFLFLEALPLLAPGVLVHVHDVYLPEDYPTSWNLGRGFLYGEQYLLHALLCFSRGFEVVWPGRRVLRERRADLAAALGPAVDLDRHCSFWFRRVDEGCRR